MTAARTKRAVRGHPSRGRAASSHKKHMGGIKNPPSFRCDACASRRSAGTTTVDRRHTTAGSAGETVRKQFWITFTNQGKKAMMPTIVRTYLLTKSILKILFFTHFHFRPHMAKKKEISDFFRYLCRGRYCENRSSTKVGTKISRYNYHVIKFCCTYLPIFPHAGDF